MTDVITSVLTMEASSFTSLPPSQSMLLIVPKLSESIINTQLLKHLAKCQMDEQVRQPLQTRVAALHFTCFHTECLAMILHVIFFIPLLSSLESGPGSPLHRTY